MINILDDKLLYIPIMENKITLSVIIFSANQDLIKVPKVFKSTNNYNKRLQDTIFVFIIMFYIFNLRYTLCISKDT